MPNFRPINYSICQNKHDIYTKIAKRCIKITCLCSLVHLPLTLIYFFLWWLKWRKEIAIENECANRSIDDNEMRAWRWEEKIEFMLQQQQLNQFITITSNGDNGARRKLFWCNFFYTMLRFFIINPIALLSFVWKFFLFCYIEENCSRWWKWWIGWNYFLCFMCVLGVICINLLCCVNKHTKKLLWRHENKNEQ